MSGYPKKLVASSSLAVPGLLTHVQGHVHFGDIGHPGPSGGPAAVASVRHARYPRDIRPTGMPSRWHLWVDQIGKTLIP